MPVNDPNNRQTTYAMQAGYDVARYCCRRRRVQQLAEVPTQRENCQQFSRGLKESKNRETWLNEGWVCGFMPNLNGFIVDINYKLRYYARENQI